MDEDARVVIVAGDGVTPLGENWANTREALQVGEAAAQYVDIPVTDWEQPVAAVVDDEWLTPPPTFLQRKGFTTSMWRKMSRTAQLGVKAVGNVLDKRKIDLGLLQEGFRANKLAVIFGIAMPDMRWTEKMAAAVFRGRAPRIREALGTIPNTPQYDTLRALGFVRGYGLVSSGACASGLNALHEAYWGIRTRRYQAALVVAADSLVSRIALKVFRTMRVLSDPLEGRPPASAGRAWRSDSAGFVLGEGATALVLTSPEIADSMRWPILVEIVGSAVCFSSYSLIAPDPIAIKRVIVEAMGIAGLSPPDVELMIGHGAGTVGDQIEADVYREIWGKAAPQLLAPSLKPGLGHWMGPIGTANALAVIDAITLGLVPPTANLDLPSGTPTHEFASVCDHVMLGSDSQHRQVQVGAAGGAGLAGVYAQCLLSKFRG